MFLSSSSEVVQCNDEDTVPTCNYNNAVNVIQIADLNADSTVGKA